MREREQGRKEEKGGKVDMKKVASFPSVLFGGAISFGLLFLPPETRRSRETLSKLKKPDLVRFKKLSTTYSFLYFSRGYFSYFFYSLQGEGRRAWRSGRARRTACGRGYAIGGEGGKCCKKWETEGQIVRRTDRPLVGGVETDIGPYTITSPPFPPDDI